MDFSMHLFALGYSIPLMRFELGLAQPSGVTNSTCICGNPTVLD